jgi:hypothetical protein
MPNFETSPRLMATERRKEQRQEHHYAAPPERPGALWERVDQECCGQHYHGNMHNPALEPKIEQIVELPRLCF